MRDRRTKTQHHTAHKDESDKENLPATQQRHTAAHTDEQATAAGEGKRTRATHGDNEGNEQRQQPHGSTNKKSKPSHDHSAPHDRRSIEPLSPAPSPSFSSLDALLAEKEAAYSQLLDKYNALSRQRVDHTAALVAQYEAQTLQLRSSSQQLTQHWQDKYAQLHTAQRQETELRRKEAEAAMAVKDVVLAEKTAQLKEQAALNDGLQCRVEAASEQISNYLLLTGTSITVPSSSSHRLVCCMVNASNRQRRIDFVLDTAQSEASGTVQYRPKRIELGGLAYPKCLKGNINFAVDRTPNFTRYLLDTLYKKADEEEEEEQQDEEGEDKQAKEGGGAEQPEAQQDEAQTAEQTASERGAQAGTVQVATDAVMA